MIVFVSESYSLFILYIYINEFDSCDNITVLISYIDDAKQRIFIIFKTMKSSYVFKNY